MDYAVENPVLVHKPIYFYYSFIARIYHPFGRQLLLQRDRVGTRPPVGAHFWACLWLSGNDGSLVSDFGKSWLGDAAWGHWWRPQRKWLGADWIQRAWLWKMDFSRSFLHDRVHNSRWHEGQDHHDRNHSTNRDSQQQKARAESARSELQESV